MLTKIKIIIDNKEKKKVQAIFSRTVYIIFARDGKVHNF